MYIFQILGEGVNKVVLRYHSFLNVLFFHLPPHYNTSLTSTHMILFVLPGGHHIQKILLIIVTQIHFLLLLILLSGLTFLYFTFLYFSNINICQQIIRTYPTCGILFRKCLYDKIRMCGFFIEPTSLPN